MCLRDFINPDVRVRIVPIQQSNYLCCWRTGSSHRRDSTHDVEYVDQVSLCLTRGLVPWQRGVMIWITHICLCFLRNITHVKHWRLYIYGHTRPVVHKSHIALRYLTVCMRQYLRVYGVCTFHQASDRYPTIITRLFNSSSYLAQP